MLDEAVQGKGGLITLVTQTGRFLVSSMTVSRCWPERTSKAIKGRTSFLEQNCDSLQQTTIHAEFRNSCYLLNLGGIQIPLSLWFPSEEVTPYLSLLQAGWDSSVTVPRPPAHSHGADTWHALDPADSPLQIDVRTEKCCGSSDFSSDSDERVKSLELLTHWNCPASYSSQTPVHSVRHCLSSNPLDLRRPEAACNQKTPPVWWEDPCLTLIPRRKRSLLNPCSG